MGFYLFLNAELACALEILLVTTKCGLQATAPPPAPLACGGGGKVKVIGPPDDMMYLKAKHIGNFEPVVENPP